ncbi:hypothetical protein [Anoxybacterium hadale]|uniref:hypothetical protein n=1 Tax=Anoxybacterium hadale TaxID=3408580 RepID=UPI003B00F3D2
MAFFNCKKRSKLFVMALVTVSIIASYSMPVSVYATEDNPREPTSMEEVSTDEPVIDQAGKPSESPIGEPSVDPSVEEPAVDPSEDPSVEAPAVEPSEDPSVEEPAVEPSEDPEQVPAESDLTAYVVEYETAAGEKLLQDKVVTDQMVGDEVSEDAVVIEGYSVDESTKNITLVRDENLITFIYKAAESVEEPLPPAEEELPPVVEIPVIEEEVVTEPAIVVEPTAAVLTITHRLNVGNQQVDEVQTVEGLEIGQVVDLEQYVLTEDWFEIASDVNSITLNEEQTSIILEYKPLEGFVVAIPESTSEEQSDL